MRGKVGESIRLNWEINKRKKRVKTKKKKKKKRENIGNGWMMWLYTDVAQQERNNNKCYVSAFKHIYIDIDFVLKSSPTLDPHMQT